MNKANDRHNIKIIIYFLLFIFITYIFTNAGSSKVNYLYGESSEGSYSIIYVHCGHEASDYGSWKIESVDEFGQNHVFLTETSAYYRSPSFSFDGEQIVYISNLNSGSFDHIWIMNSDGSNPHQITEWPTDIMYFDPYFSPDGNYIIFSGKEEGKPRDIYRMSVDGTNIVNLTNTPGITEEKPTYTYDGKIVFLAYGDDGNIEIIIMDSDGYQFLRILGLAVIHFNIIMVIHGTMFTLQILGVLILLLYFIIFMPVVLRDTLNMIVSVVITSLQIIMV